MLYVICFLLGCIIGLLYLISKSTGDFICYVDKLIFELRLRNHYDYLHFNEDKERDDNND